MQSNYLLPYQFKRIGWLLLIIGIVAGLFLMASGMESDLLKIKVLAIFGGDETFMVSNASESSRDYFVMIENSVVDELISIAIIIGGLFVGFSKEKIEDEFIYKLRNDSLVWAIIFNYVILLLMVMFVYNLSFFNILVYNMFTPLFFFIIRFNVLKMRASHEE